MEGIEGAPFRRQMCIELQNLRIFIFRLASPKISNCLDKIKTGNQKARAMKSRQNLYLLLFKKKKKLSIDTPSVRKKPTAVNLS